GFDRYDFSVEGKPVLLVVPKKPAPGRPWVWHGEFFGHKPAPDIALLERGWDAVDSAMGRLWHCSRSNETGRKLVGMVYPEGPSPRQEETMKSKKPIEGATNGKRKRWGAAEKLRIVLAGMEPGVEISDLCRREGVNPTMYYQW